jgi:hypothetical protein
VLIANGASEVFFLAKDHFNTQAKSRDHEIVRAQKKVSEGRPNTPPKSCSSVPRYATPVLYGPNYNHLQCILVQY